MLILTEQRKSVGASAYLVAVGTSKLSKIIQGSNPIVNVEFSHVLLISLSLLVLIFRNAINKLSNHTFIFVISCYSFKVEGHTFGT